MKRIIILSFVLILALSLVPVAFAVTDASTGVTVTGTSGITFKSSTNVVVIVDTDGASVGAFGSQYAAMSKHLNGNRTIGAAYNATAIYFNDTIIGVGTALVTGDLSGTDSAVFSAWSTM